MKPRVAVIGPANLSLSPRGERFRTLASAFAEVADVELLSAGKDHPPAKRRPRLSRRLANRLGQAVMLDCDELDAINQLRGWPAAVDAALLIGFPFSALSWAARRLARAGVPYVVDIGDPWVLTATDSPPASLATLRARRAERFMWEHAAGAIVTTEPQATALRQRFGGLPTLVRPNGFALVDHALRSADRANHPIRELRIVHYGALYEPRLDLPEFLDGLARTGKWETIRFTTYGRDLDGSLPRVGPAVQTEIRPPRPWQEIVATAAEHDVAIVVGNRNPSQLPSKAVQYLTLPIPRVALVSEARSDALEAYVADKPGWLTISSATDPERSTALLAAHVERRWTPAELKPPESEAWASVTPRILTFVSSCTAVPLSHLATSRMPSAQPAIAPSSDR